MWLMASNSDGIIKDQVVLVSAWQWSAPEDMALETHAYAKPRDPGRLLVESKIAVPYLALPKSCIANARLAFSNLDMH